MLEKFHLETESQFRVRESPAIHFKFESICYKQHIFIPVLRLSCVGSRGRMYGLLSHFSLRQPGSLAALVWVIQEELQ